MSYDVMIIGCSKDGQPLFQLDPVYWWDSDELMEDDRFTMKQETSSFTDFEAGGSGISGPRLVCGRPRL